MGLYMHHPYLQVTSPRQGTFSSAVSGEGNVLLAAKYFKGFS